MSILGRRTVRFMGIFSALVVACLALQVSTAQALTLNPNPPALPDPQGIPSTIRSTLESCDTSGSSPAFARWLSLAGQPGNTDIQSEVEYGDTSLSLRYNFSGVVCYSSSAVLRSRNQISQVNTSAPAGQDFNVSGLVGTTRTVSYLPDYQSVGNYETTSRNFNMNFPGGITTSGLYFADIYTKTINEFVGGVFFCVGQVRGADGVLRDVQVNSLDDFDDCPEVITDLRDRLTVVAPVVNEPSCTASPSRSVVIPNQSFTVGATVTNPNSVPITVTGVRVNPFGQDFPLASPDLTAGLNIPANSSNNSFRTETQTRTSPGTYNFRWVVSWQDGTGSGADILCFTTVQVIEPQVLDGTCSVLSLGSAIVGGTSRVGVTITNTGGVPLTIPSNAPRYSFSPAGATPSSGVASPTNGSRVIPAGGSVTFQSPDISFSSLGSYSASWQGFSGTGVTNGVSANVALCGGGTTSVVDVSSRPYFKIYGGDVSVGGYFGLGEGADACDGLTNHIPAFNDGPVNNGNPDDNGAQGRVYGFAISDGLNTRGSSVEFALQALGSIEGVYSASQRTTTPTPTTGLTLANTGVPGSYGGSYGDHRCISNYWRGSSTATEYTSDQLDLADVVDDQQLIRSGNDDTALTISRSAITDDSLSTTIYNEGTITIDSDIVNNIGTWTSRDDVGSIYIIAKGDIFIRPDVSQIDAVLVAIPDDDGTRGRVYTCRSASLSNPSNHGGAACENPLVINGSVIARELRLGRTNGDISQSSPRETAAAAPGPAEPTRILVNAQSSGSPAGQEIQVVAGNDISLLTGVRLGTETLTGSAQTFEYEVDYTIESIIVKMTDDNSGDARINYIEVGGRRLFANDSTNVQRADWNGSTCAVDSLSPSSTSLLFCDNASFLFTYTPAVNPPSPPTGNESIAETINLRPEYFVGRPVQPPIVSDLYRSDSVTALPPVL